MHNTIEPARRWFARAYARLDVLLYGFSAYALPVGIAILSLLALTVWHHRYDSGNPQSVVFRYVVDAEGRLTAPEAAAALGERSVRLVETNRSEAPVWFSFVVPAPPEGERAVIEFPSRHAVDIQCWDENLLPSGGASRDGAYGSLSAVKAGFALQPPETSGDSWHLCRSRFVGPARLTVDAWTPADLQASSDNFHRKAGLLDGGMIVLALFMLITALIVRQSRYLLFSAWLLVSLRVGALSAGWDMQWLGQNVPHDWLLRSRLLTVATYCVLTITLFASMFRDELARTGKATVLRILQWMCFPLLLLSATLSYRTFLPFLWVAASVTVVTVIVLLVRLLMHARSAVAVLYSASLTITLLASLSEVLAAAFGLRALTGAINHVTAALSSALLASLAMAEQMRQEHEHRVQAQAELEHTYEAMPIGMFTLDMSGQFMSANPALLEMLGQHVLEPGRNAWGQYLDGDSFSRLLNAVHQEQDAELEVESLSAGADGERKRFLVRATLARNKIEGSLQDISEKYKALQELQFLANNDPLTKVYNRRGVEAMLDAALRQLADGKPVALAYLDLDRFKLINGLYGHAAGDEVLKQICGRVTNMLTGSQQIGRVGGDEFLIVFPDTPIELAAWTCRGIIASIGNVPYKLGDKAFQVRASIGLIEIADDMSVKDMIATADRACRAAKKGNVQGLVVYDKSASVFHDHEAEFGIVERLSAPNGPQGLYLDMQPIMSLKAPLGSLNFEVLLRMRSEDGGVIPAGRIVGAAENSGRTSVIDRWVLATTLEWIDANQARLRRTEFVCMNLSGASLNDERFIQDTIRLLEANPRAAARLCIEITESVALHDRGNTRRFIDKVRSYGVRVALDDFGAGYTSFAYLKELPADVLKIDGSFVVNINAHPANVAIVEAIVSLARSLGMQTIAEWAEDAATVETLAEIGVDHVQGYAIARPQAPEKILGSPSAAAFIQDEGLAGFVRTLGDPLYSTAQLDMLSGAGNKDLH
ncbi:MAG TPA: EAL domain-containing protein [Noviherbaspirillum sp.]|jgi:diguanylate cyclase (GGDEF)-like protein|uniref:EAL domain-containing protein n=1 Tax=Noviherbaspirillum sp. TaxID=1926288 RepID=UPI002F9298D2